MITDEEILAIAEEYNAIYSPLLNANAVAFARAIEAKTREECANLCDDIQDDEAKTNQFRYQENCASSDQGASYCAAAIRSQK